MRSVSFHTNLRLVSLGALLTVAPESAVVLQTSGLKLKVIATPWSGSNDIVFAHRDGLGSHATVQTLRTCFMTPAPVRQTRRQTPA